MEEMKLTRFNSQNVKRFVHYRIAFLVLIKANWSKKKNLDLMEQKLRANSKRIKCSHFKNAVLWEDDEKEEEEEMYFQPT